MRPERRVFQGGRGPGRDIHASVGFGVVTGQHALPDRGPEGTRIVVGLLSHLLGMHPPAGVELLLYGRVNTSPVLSWRASFVSGHDTYPLFDILCSRLESCNLFF